MAITRTTAGLVDSDQFTRADASTPGGNWTTEGTSMTAAIVSNRLDVSGGGGSPSRPGAKMNGSGVSRTENFGQVTYRAESIVNGNPIMGFMATSARSGYSIGQNNTLLALQEWASGTPSNLSLPSLASSNNTDYTCQLFSKDSLQQAFSTGDSSATQTASATDTSQNGVAKIPYVIRAGTSGTANSAIFDDFLWMKSKYLVVTDLPTGYKVKIVNGSGSVVAQATESGGTATVDGSRFGGATEFVPFAGWAKLRITNAADQTVEEYSATGVYPGDEYSYGIPFSSGFSDGFDAAPIDDSAFDESFSSAFDAAPGNEFTSAFSSAFVRIPSSGGSAAEFAASVSAAATVSAALTTAITAAASVAGQASVSASLSTEKTLAGSVSGSCSVAADLSTAIRMAASVIGSATASAAMQADPAQFAASASAQASVSAALSTSISLGASVSSDCASAGALETAIRFSASAEAACSSVADLLTAIRAAANVAGDASAVGDLDTAITLAASLSISAAVTAKLRDYTTFGFASAEFVRSDLGGSAAGASIAGGSSTSGPDGGTAAGSTYSGTAVLKVGT